LCAVLNNIKANDFTLLLKTSKNDGITVYIRKGIILMEMAAKIVYVKPSSFYDLARELSKKTLVFMPL
jgi:hypothetical protein